MGGVALLARILAAVKPVDVIDEMLIADVMSLEWEVLRWRRLKTRLIRSRGLAAVENFLREQLDSDVYADLVADYVTEILQEKLPDEQAKDARKLARNARHQLLSQPLSSPAKWPVFRTMRRAAPDAPIARLTNYAGRAGQIGDRPVGAIAHGPV